MMPEGIPGMGSRPNVQGPDGKGDTARQARVAIRRSGDRGHVGLQERRLVYPELDLVRLSACTPIYEGKFPLDRETPEVE
jgi:hypothetical protein